MTVSTPLSHRSRRNAAFAIATMVVLIMLALSHHPVATHYGDARHTFAHMAQLSTSARLIHGSLCAMLAVLTAALAVFHAALGRRGPLAVAPLCAYGIGCLLLGLAMLFDGFVIPVIVSRLATASAPEVVSGGIAMALIGAIVQIFSKAGFVAQSVAMLMWSGTAATDASAGARVRWSAWIGMVAGLGPAALLLLTDLHLTPHSLMAIVAMHAAWYLAVAWCLLGRAPAGC